MNKFNLVLAATLALTVAGCDKAGNYISVLDNEGVKSAISIADTAVNNKKEDGSIDYMAVLTKLLGNTNVSAEKAVQDGALASITKSINKQYSTSYTDEQVKQIYEIAKAEDIDFATVAKEAAISKAGAIIFSGTEKAAE